jgi:hypothetical protein
VVIQLLSVMGAGTAFGPAQVLEWKQTGGCRYAELAVPNTGKPGFGLLSPASTGIAFTNLLAEQRHLTNQILLNGSGVACGDVDGDGWTDVYFCCLDGPNKLYRNLGHWKFQDITEASGVACPDLDASSAALADLDGDGDLDLIVGSLGGGTHLFFNDGRGRFAEPGPPLNGRKGGATLALGDIDGDGFLDLYIANYRTSALMDMPNTRFWFKDVGGRRVVDRVNGRLATDPEWTNHFVVSAGGGISELGEVDVLYRNLGGRRFEPVPFLGGAFLDEAGKPLTQEPFDWGLTAMMRDLNGDGLPDIYVCNDFDTPDRIWLNLGGGRFQALPRLALRKTSMFTMNVDFADINRDGFDDFVLLDMLNRRRVNRLTTMPDRRPPAYVPGELENRPQYMQTMLCLNRGDTTYADIGQLAGVAASDWAWNAIFLDVDLDGWEDLLIANGNERDGRNMDVAAQLRAQRTAREMTSMEILQARRLFPHFRTPNLAFRNRGDLTFEEVSKSWGFDYVGVSHGMALADLDNDGDLDVVVNHLNDAAGIYRNDAPAPRLGVRLKGRPPNTRGIGAKIKVLGGAVPMQSQEIICGGRYLSCDDAMRTFACGAATTLTIEVAWRSGLRSVVSNAQPNRLYEIDEAAARPAVIAPSPRPTPFFQDVSALISHRHTDVPFDDFERQPLLPWRLSHLGPGASWFDLDHDGWDDLIIGSGRGGYLGVYRNDGRGGFQRLDGALYSQAVTRDQTAILGWRKPDGSVALLAGSSNYEDGLPAGGAVRSYDLSRSVVEDLLPGQASSTGPLALGDVDGDGALDLFVGGRVLPGQYPAAATSLLYHGKGGQWVADAENNKLLRDVGLVSGAVFCDFDGDGLPDLVLACEWGPVRLFRNDRGRYAEATAALGLDRYPGWWNGVTAGDFDGDGRLDIVACGWGRNTKYESSRAQPLRMYHGDLDGNGLYDCLEAHYDAELLWWVPERGLNTLGAALPFLRENWTSHRAYALASLDDLLGDRLKPAQTLQASWLESTVFLNRGDHFEPRVLPVEAQMAPAFAICVADLDGDGQEDLLLSQNFFGVPADTPRCDAGRGLLLKGNGRGGFAALSGSESGIEVYGEQRGAAACDYDGDGRVDWVVTQNGAPTKLYHNGGAKPGLRVRVAGPPGNPDGIGAAMRLIFGARSGPVREIHAGSGYWSQDSAVQVLGAPEPPTHIWIRWPGGMSHTAPVPPGTRELKIDQAGQLTVLR